MSYTLYYRRNSKERYWVLKNASLWEIKNHLEAVLKNTTETELMIIVKKEAQDD